MSHEVLFGIDFCFNAAQPGTPSPDGHYDLGFGFISRTSEQSTWKKVQGFVEDMKKNDGFIFTFYDLSGTVSSIDFVTISMRPGGDQSVGGETSPFGGTDTEKLLKGQTLTNVGTNTSTGCGDGTTTPSGNRFDAGSYVLKHDGHFEMTIELRVTVNDEQIEFKCDPKMRVNTD